MIKRKYRYLRTEHGFIYTAYQDEKETALTFVTYATNTDYVNCLLKRSDPGEFENWLDIFH